MTKSMLRCQTHTCEERASFQMGQCVPTMIHGQMTIDHDFEVKPFKFFASSFHGMIQQC